MIRRLIDYHFRMNSFQQQYYRETRARYAFRRQMNRLRARSAQ